jgi:hypothetical protein
VVEPLHLPMYRIPSTYLSDFVSLLWCHRSDQIFNARERVLPTGEVNLIIQLDSPRGFQLQSCIIVVSISRISGESGTLSGYSQSCMSRKGAKEDFRYSNNG